MEQSTSTTPASSTGYSPSASLSTSSSSSPSIPSSQALASRGRRPALIPHNADLSLSLSAAATALGMASYSPNRQRGGSGGVLWVLPSSSPPTPLHLDWSSNSSGESLLRWKRGGRDDAIEYDLDIDDMEEREVVRSLVEKDVFSWVNEADSEHALRSQSAKIKAPETAPTSPLSGNFPEDLEFRRRRLQEAEREMGSRR